MEVGVGVGVELGVAAELGIALGVGVGGIEWGPTYGKGS